MTETLLSRGGRAMCALELPPHTPEEAWWQGIIPTAVQVLARRPVYEIASDTYWGGHGLCSVPKPAEGSSHCMLEQPQGGSSNTLGDHVQ